MSLKEERISLIEKLNIIFHGVVVFRQDPDSYSRITWLACKDVNHPLASPRLKKSGIYNFAKLDGRKTERLHVIELSAFLTSGLSSVSKIRILVDRLLELYPDRTLIYIMDSLNYIRNKHNGVYIPYKTIKAG